MTIIGWYSDQNQYYMCNNLKCFLTKDHKWIGGTFKVS